MHLHRVIQTFDFCADGLDLRQEPFRQAFGLVGQFMRLFLDFSSENISVPNTKPHTMPNSAK